MFDKVTGQDAQLALFTGGPVPGQGMDQHCQTGCLRRCHALRQQCPHQPGQHIAHTGGGHTRIAMAAQTGEPLTCSISHQRTHTLEDRGTAEAFRQLTDGPGPVGLHLRGADPQQSGGFGGVRRDDSRLAQYH